MKMKTTLLLAGLVPLLASCVSQPITLAPVGPSPFAGLSASAGIGQLQVFSSLAEQTDDQNQGSSGGEPVWYQHTDYSIYNGRGTRIKHVDNSVGHYATAPRIISLSPGNYTVKAEARDWLTVTVPVVIERDRLTKVHLDGDWNPPPGTPKAEVVTAPNGSPVGWRAGLIADP